VNPVLEPDDASAAPRRQVTHSQLSTSREEENRYRDLPTETREKGDEGRTGGTPPRPLLEKRTDCGGLRRVASVDQTDRIPNLMR